MLNSTSVISVVGFQQIPGFIVQLIRAYLTSSFPIINLPKEGFFVDRRTKITV